MDHETYPPFTFDESPDQGDSPTIVLDRPVPPPPPAPPAPERGRGLGAIAVVAATCSVVGATAGVFAGRAMAPAAKPAAAASSQLGAPVQPVSIDSGSTSYVGVAAKVLPSVVSITVTLQGGRGSGSGVVLRADGYVLTNNHVIESANTIRVTFNDGSSATGRVVGADAASDLAVVKVDKTGLVPAALGRSSSVKVGDQVLAVGSPLGLSGTVTAGIVSALNRPVNTTETGSGFGAPSVSTVIDAIQTDAAINPGNSGGALVDMAGQVVGINSAIATAGNTFGGQAGNIGVGFAIPIDQAKVIAQQLIDTGRASRAQMGVSVGAATTADGGVRVVLQDVTPGGPAQAAGLRAGDTILTIGGKQVTDADSLIATVRSHRPGETVEVQYERDGTRHTASVRLSDANAG
jgi:putative serine protease PepD